MAYDLHSPSFSTASSASFPDDSPVSDSHFDDYAYPVFANTDSYPIDYDCHWSPDMKKHPQAYHIPRSQNVYPQNGYKPAPYIQPPIPPQRQQQAQNIHSPHPSHPLQHQLAAPSPSSTAVFEVDEDWQQHAPHYTPHGHSLAAYSSSDPPRIKQEDLPGFSAIPGYADPHLLQHHHHQRNTGLYEQPLNLPLPSQVHDPNTNGAQYPSHPSIPPSHSHSHPQPQSAVYFSGSFQPQPQQQFQHATHHRQHIHIQPSQHQRTPSFQAFNGGTIHPADLSPTTESCTSASPLSPYADLSAVVSVDPRFGHQHQHQQSGGDLKNSLAWREDRRDSLVSLADSELSAHSHHSHGIPEMEIGMGMDGMVDGLGLGMAGVVVGGMPLVGVDQVDAEEDAVGEDDAEGDDDWDHGVQQGQFQAVQQLEYIHERREQGEAERDGEVQTHPGEVQLKREADEDGEDEVSESDSAEGEAEADGEAEGEYEDKVSDLSSSEEDEDDPDDPEFVPGARRRPLRRQSTFPVTGRESSSAPYQTFAYSNITGEGRSLRPRSSSARYNPYPSSNSYSESAGGYFPSEQQFDQQYSERTVGGRRYSSASTSSSTQHHPRSSSSHSHSHSGSLSNSSSGLTTTTTRRRLRPSSTLPVPVPVPNLTKKSRGRRVPTMESLEDLRSAASGAGRKRQSAGGRTARMYLCDVEGCGKCFARGEHLKRHVRSIHTYEKPHKCLYPGCGKDFSRHDNLGQHMRVHKDYVQEGVTPPSSTGRSVSSSARRKPQTQV